MTTEKKALSDDLLEIQESFNTLFESSANKRTLVLQSHEDSNQCINPDQYNILQGLGLSNVANVKEFEDSQAHLKKLGLTLETIKELSEIKTKFGKNIISYNNLCSLCETHNLYFGDSKLFTGKIPPESIKDIQEFNFETFKSHYSVLESRPEESIVNCNMTHRAQVMIAAPSNMFKLKDVFISVSRELILFPPLKASFEKPSNAHSPIVLLPFKASATKEVFFIVITHWDNSKSII